MSNGRAKDLFDQFMRGGEEAIDGFIAEQISEEFFIDYKRSANDGNEAKLHQTDRENFARAIAGFANSEGGVIVWGVDCRNDPARGDVPNGKFPLKNAKRFASYLEGAASGCTLPPHDGVKHYVIEASGTGEGFVVTYVAKSMFAPHQCIVGKYKNRYYVRVGSNFELASHGLLAGMFGRQPTPNIFVMWGCGGKMAPSSYAPLITHLPTSTPYVWDQITIRNHGSAVVEDLYVNLELRVPGPNCVAEMPQKNPRWEFHESVGGWHLISSPGFRLAPAGMVAPVSFSVYLKPPFDDPLQYDISFGCKGSPVHRIFASIPPDRVESAYRAFLGSDQGKQAGFEFARDVLDLKPDQEYFESVER